MSIVCRINTVYLIKDGVWHECVVYSTLWISFLLVPCPKHKLLCVDCPGIHSRLLSYDTTCDFQFFLPPCCPALPSLLFGRTPWSLVDIGNRWSPAKESGWCGQLLRVCSLLAWCGLHWCSLKLTGIFKHGCCCLKCRLCNTRSEGE